MKQLKSFFTFDLPVNYNYIYSRFRQAHEGQRNVYACWPAEATGRRLINEYWSNALWHYLLLIVLADVAVLFYNGQLHAMYMFASVTLGMAAYLPLYLLLYRPIFTGEFLPKLETVIAESGNSYWCNAFNQGYEDWLTPTEMDRLKIYFQQRHILAHAEGFVDQKYIDRSGDQSYVVGQRIVIKENAILDFLELIRTLTNKISEV